MLYVEKTPRDQIRLTTLENCVPADSDARLIDAFVDSLDLEEFGIRTAKSEEGRPMHDPAGLLKIYLLGTRCGVRSSRRLERACRHDDEFRWLMYGTVPDYRTIARFRNENAEAIKRVFKELNRRIRAAVPCGDSSVDGTKMKANASPESTKTKEQLEASLARAEKELEKLLKEFEQNDRQEDGEERARRELLTKRSEKYAAGLQHIQETGESQASFTDPNAPS